jgi:hypothetical protein
VLGRRWRRDLVPKLRWLALGCWVDGMPLPHCRTESRPVSEVQPRDPSCNTDQGGRPGSEDKGPDHYFFFFQRSCIRSESYGANGGFVAKRAPCSTGRGRVAGAISPLVPRCSSHVDARKPVNYTCRRRDFGTGSTRRRDAARWRDEKRKAQRFVLERSKSQTDL